MIVGYYRDRFAFHHGFLLQGRAYAALDDPRVGKASFVAVAMQGTQASGINQQGDIVGSYYDSNGVEHGFLLHGGHCTTIDDPQAGTQRTEGTVANGIDERGDIVGAYIDGSGVEHGFLLNG